MVSPWRQIKGKNIFSILRFEPIAIIANVKITISPSLASQ